MKTSVYALALLVSGSLAPLEASFIEGFGHGVDAGKWQLTTNTIRPLLVLPSGGNPGPFLYGQVSTAIPTWYVPSDVESPFIGNYYERGVLGLSMDLNIIVAADNVPFRNLTLDIQSTLGTGDPTKGLEAYFIGPDTGTRQHGWHRYTYPVDAASTTIPLGWVLTRGDGAAGTDADWRKLMEGVETLGFEMGIPGYAYPELNIWSLGIDNVAILANEGQ